MCKFEIDIEKANEGYKKVNGTDAPPAMLELVQMFNEMIEGAYQKGLENQKLTENDFLFPMKATA